MFGETAVEGRDFSMAAGGREETGLSKGPGLLPAWDAAPGALAGVMNFCFRMLVGIVGGGLVAAMAPGARAQTFTQRIDYTSANFDTPTVTTDTPFAQTFIFTFNRFDAALGLLTSVTVNYAFHFTGTVLTGPGGGSGGFSAGGLLNFDGGTAGGVGTGGGNGGPPSSLLALTGNLAGDLGTTGSGFITGAAVTGAGQSTLQWVMSGSLWAGGGAQAHLQLGSGNFEVIYNYTPSAIPEPSTWAVMLGAGALALAMGRRCQQGASAAG